MRKSLEERAKEAQRKADAAREKLYWNRVRAARDKVWEACSAASDHLINAYPEGTTLENAPENPFLAIIQGASAAACDYAAKAAGFDTWQAFQAEQDRLEAEQQAECDRQQADPVYQAERAERRKKMLADRMAKEAEADDFADWTPEERAKGAQVMKLALVK